MNAEEAVLRELKDESPGWLFGLEIVSRCQAREDLSWWVKFNSGRGSIYVLLHRLQERGWVESRYVEEGQEPRRRQYRITEDGLRDRTWESNMEPVPA